MWSVTQIPQHLTRLCGRLRLSQHLALSEHNGVGRYNELVRLNSSERASFCSSHAQRVEEGLSTEMLRLVNVGRFRAPGQPEQFDEPLAAR
jgi:hypothetical protein